MIRWNKRYSLSVQSFSDEEKKVVGENGNWNGSVSCRIRREGAVDRPVDAIRNRQISADDGPVLVRGGTRAGQALAVAGHLPQPKTIIW